MASALPSSVVGSDNIERNSRLSARRHPPAREPTDLRRWLTLRRLGRCSYSDTLRCSADDEFRIFQDKRSVDFNFDGPAADNRLIGSEEHSLTVAVRQVGMRSVSKRQTPVPLVNSGPIAKRLPARTYASGSAPR